MLSSMTLAEIQAKDQDCDLVDFEGDDRIVEVSFEIGDSEEAAEVQECSSDLHRSLKPLYGERAQAQDWIFFEVRLLQRSGR